MKSYPNKIRYQSTWAIALVAVLFLGMTAFAAETKEEAEDLSGYIGDIGIKDKKFTMAIWGDPQVAFWREGYEFRHSGRAAGQFRSKFEDVNPRLRQAVELTNSLEPGFVITLGDNVHGSGEWEHYKTFVDSCKPLKMPIYILMGNHDWRPRAREFENNPYGKRDYGNFLWAERQLGLPELINYSFDAGEWHFVLLSQPAGVDEIMDQHPEYYEWLESDLKKNRDRPTMFFTHHPPLPVGRRYFDYYGPSAKHRGRLCDILTEYGNVRYAFFGHVHNTVASIPLISWRYKGTAFIVLPNSSNTTRTNIYNETTKSSWGVAILEMDGKECGSIAFHTLAGEVIPIKPDELPEYTDDLYGYLKPEWAWPAGDFLVNGDFERPINEGWFISHTIPYDRPPIQKCMLRTGDAARGGQHLYLYTKDKDTMSIILCDVRQAVAACGKDAWPQLSLRYKIFPDGHPVYKPSAAYVVVSGYAKDQSRPSFVLGYFLGEKAEYRIFRPYCRRIENIALLEMKERPAEWVPLTLNIRSDYEACLKDLSWEDLDLSDIVVTLGVSNAGAGFDDVAWEISKTKTPASKGFKRGMYKSKRK